MRNEPSVQAPCPEYQTICNLGIAVDVLVADPDSDHLPIPALSSPAASKVVTVSLKPTPRESINTFDCNGGVRPSVQFVNRFDSEYVRRLQRACNPNFPSEECLHAGNIG